REGRLYWADIDGGRLFRVDHQTGEHECFHQNPDKIGGFTFQDDGSLLLFEVNRIARLGKDGKRRVLAEQIDSGMVRFNDVIADPEGRVFAGTIGKSDESGGLFRVDLDGAVETLWRGTGWANGMRFRPDLRQFGAEAHAVGAPGPSPQGIDRAVQVDAKEPTAFIALADGAGKHAPLRVRDHIVEPDHAAVDLLGEHAALAVFAEHRDAVDLEQQQRAVVLKREAADLVGVLVKALVLPSLVVDAK